MTASTDPSGWRGDATPLATAPYRRAAPGRPAVAILGKVQRIVRDPSQLDARVATAAALWHSASEKPWILYVASDVHGPEQTPDGLGVRRRLVDDLGVDRDDVVYRPWSNCTVVEARALRVLARALSLGAITALTHPYHAPRARRILSAALPRVEVVAVRPESVAALALPGLDLGELVARSMPNRADRAREAAVEAVLGVVGAIDPRGRLERRLARAVRTAAPRRTHRSIAMT